MTEKIIKILKTFSEEDIKNFKKFLKSPFFFKGRDLTKYFNTISNFRSETVFDKDKIISLYFGKKNGSGEKKAATLRVLNSDLTKVLDEFLSANSLKEMSFYKNYLLLEEYSARGLYEFGKQLSEEMLEKKEDLDPGYIKHLQLIMLINLRNFFCDLTNTQSEIYKGVKQQSEEYISFLTSSGFHFLNSLKVNPEIYKIEAKNEYLSLLFKEINFDNFLKELPDNFPGVDIINLDIELIKIMLDKERFPESYKNLNRMYYAAFKSMERSQKRNYFTTIFNLYINNVNEKINQHKFELLKYVLNENVFPDESVKHLSLPSYKVFLLTGLQANDIKWSEKFFKQYIEKVNPNEKENLTFYSQAYIYNYKGDFIRSLNEINNFEFSNEILTYDMKLMQMKNYYELSSENISYLENLNYAIDAFAHYLDNNKKFAEKYNSMGKEFLKGLKLLMKHKFHINGGKKDSEFALRRFKESTRNQWLLTKISEIFM